MPETLPMVPTAVLPLVQVPPVVPSVKVMEEPTFTGVIPEMTGGTGFTVTVAKTDEPEMV